MPRFELALSSKQEELGNIHEYIKMVGGVVP